MVLARGTSQRQNYYVNMVALPLLAQDVKTHPPNFKICPQIFKIHPLEFHPPSFKIHPPNFGGWILNFWG